MRALFKLGFDLVEAGTVILLDPVCCGIANQCAMAWHDYFMHGNHPIFVV